MLWASNISLYARDSTEAMDVDSQSDAEADSKPKTGEKREKRTSRACLTCRKRKSACDL